jgi:glycerol uptake facilitator-like aquaporin
VIRVAQAVYVTALGLWVGGIAVLGALVAPVTFREAPTRADAGRIFGSVLEAFGWIEAGFAAVIVVSAWALRKAAPRESRAGVVRLGLAVAMAALCSTSVFALNPAVRAAASKGASARPAGDPARERFDALHSWSTRVMASRLVAGLLLLAYSGATIRGGDGA